MAVSILENQFGRSTNTYCCRKKINPKLSGWKWFVRSHNSVGNFGRVHMLPVLSPGITDSAASGWQRGWSGQYQRASLPCLVPQCFCTYHFHMVSWVFLTAWWSQGSWTAYTDSGFPRAEQKQLCPLEARSRTSTKSLPQHRFFGFAMVVALSVFTVFGDTGILCCCYLSLPSFLAHSFVWWIIIQPVK